MGKWHNSSIPCVLAGMSSVEFIWALEWGLLEASLKTKKSNLNTEKAHRNVTKNSVLLKQTDLTDEVKLLKSAAGQGVWERACNQSKPTDITLHKGSCLQLSKDPIWTTCLMSAFLKNGIIATHTATLAWLNMAAKIFLLTDMHNFGFRAMDHILLVKQNWNILG